MKTKNKFLYLLTACTFFACKAPDANFDKENPLIGTWVFNNYQNQKDGKYSIIYSRKEAFDKDKYGIAFFTKSKLVERKNAGWCGTPPISLSEFNGNWIQSDNLIIFNSEDWRGKTIQKYEIVSLGNTSLELLPLE